MNQPLEFPFGFYTNDNTPQDGKYFNRLTGQPYVDMTTALSLLPIGVRYKGLTININGLEYWWPASDSDLSKNPVIKIFPTSQLDGKVEGGNIDISAFGSGNITVGATKWLLTVGGTQSLYETTTGTLFTGIGLSSAGNQRYVAFYGNSSNAIIKVEGTQSAAAVLPSTPANTVLLGYVLVTSVAASPPVVDLSGYAQKDATNVFTKTNTFQDDTEFKKTPTVNGVPIGSFNAATVNEINTGSDNSKGVTPLGLEGSKYLDRAFAKISATTAGTSTVYTASLTPALASYAAGQPLVLTFNVANGANATVNVNGLGARNLARIDGTNVQANDLTTGTRYFFVYDGTSFRLFNIVYNEVQGIQIPTITPSNTPIVGGNTLKQIAEKTQGQIDYLNTISGLQNALGVRFTDNFARASLGSNYTKTGTVASFAPDGSKLIVSGGNGTFLEYITRNNYTSNADDYTVSITFKVNVVNSTSYGLGIRLDSYSNGTQKQSTGYYVQTDNSSSNGFIRNLGNTQVNDGSGTISVNDIIRLTIKCYKNVQYITSENLTKKTTNYATYKNTLLTAATNTLLPNCVRAAIFTTGGTFEVTDFTFFVNTVEKPDYGFIGDSLISGYYGGAIDGRMVNRIAQVDKSKKVIVYGRQGCVTADIADNLTELLAFNAKTWFLNIGFNDVAQGRTDTITKLNTIVPALEAAGSTVIFLSILLNKTLSDSIRAAFPSNRFIDINTPITNAAGTAYLAKYNADTTHPNALAQITMAYTLMNSAQDLFPSFNPVLVNDLKFGIAGDAYQNDVTIGTLDNFALDFIVNSVKSMRLSAAGALKLGNSNNANASSIIDIESTAKGALIPRMTTVQFAAISSKGTGLMAYDTTTNRPTIYNGTSVKQVAYIDDMSNTVSAASTITLTSQGYYTFNGTTATWTLPTLASSGTFRFVLMNQGSGTVTVNSNAGGNDIFSGGSAINTFSLNVGEVAILYNNTLSFFRQV